MDAVDLQAENAELRARLQSVTAGHAKDLDVLAERAEKAEAENLQWRQAHEDLQAIMRTQAEQSAATCRDLLRRAERAEAQALALREALRPFVEQCEYCEGTGNAVKTTDGTDRILVPCGNCTDARNALTNTDAGKGLLEIKRAAERLVDNMIGYCFRERDLIDIRQVVDAYRAEQGGGKDSGE